MSNSNNIYNIIGRLQNLEPQVEPAAPTQTIYESVEARGSVVEGIARVEQNLSEKYMGFKKVAAAAKAGGADNPEAVAASIGRKKYGKAAFQKAAAQGKKMGEDQLDEYFFYPDTRTRQEKNRAANEPQDTLSRRNPGQIGRMQNRPDKSEYRDVVANQTRKTNFAGDSWIEPGNDYSIKGPKGPLPEEAMMEKAPPGMEDMVLKLKKQYPGHPEKAFATAWSIYNKKHGKAEESVAEGVNIDSQIKRTKDRIYQLKDWNTTGYYDKKIKELQAKLKELQSQKKGIKEGKTIWTDKGRTHIGHYGTEYTGDEEGDDDDDKKSKSKTKKTRGRPKKDDSERSSASLPKFGTKADHKPSQKTKTHPGVSMRSHSISDEPPKGSPERGEWEAKQARKEKRTKKTVKENNTMFLQALTESVNFKKMMEEQHMTVDEMLENLSNDIKAFKDTGECSDLLRDCMMIHSHGKKQIADEAITIKKSNVPAYRRDPLTLDDLERERTQALSHPEHPDYNTPIYKRMAAEKPVGDEELNELARLAGLEITDESAAMSQQDIATLDSEISMMEMDRLDWEAKNRVNAAREAFDAGDYETAKHEMSQAESIQGWAVDGGADEDDFLEAALPKTTLEDIAKLSGIAQEGRDYGDTDIDPAPEYDNTPDEHIESEEVLTKGGDGEVAGKEKQMSKDGAARFSDNVMAKEEVEESKDPLAALSRDLRAAYESIKIQR